jgi:hypothetical protein
VNGNAAVGDEQSAIRMERNLLRGNGDGRRLLCRAKRCGRKKGENGNDAEEPPHTNLFDRLLILSW